MSDTFQGYGGTIQGIETAEVGKLYQLKVTAVSTDWETGYVDDVDIGFVEYTPPENPTT